MTLRQAGSEWRLGALAVGLLLFGVTVYPREGWLLDDSLIFQNFVRNAADGHSLVYGPGAPVEGYSSPLWVLLLWGLAALGLRGLLAAKAFGALCGLATVAIVATLPLGRAPGWVRVAGVALLALQPSLAWWAASGLDTPLVELLMAALLAGAISGRQWVVALAGGLLAVTRPEGALLTAVAAAHCLWRAREDRSAPAFASWAALLVGPAALWEIFRVVRYGSWLANSALAKIGPEPYLTYQTPRVESLLSVLKSFTYLSGPWAALVLAIFLARRRLPDPRAQAARAACFGLVLAALAFIAATRVDWMPFGRFIVPFSPAMILALELGWERRWTIAGAGVLGAGALAALLEGQRDFSPEQASRSGQHMLASWSPARRPFLDPLPTEFSGYYYSFYLIRYTVPGDRVLHLDVGQTGYLASDLVVSDQFGLVSREERLYNQGALTSEQMLAHWAGPPLTLAFVMFDPATGAPMMRASLPLMSVLERDYTLVGRSSWWSGIWELRVFVRNDAVSRQPDCERFLRWTRNAPGIVFDTRRILGDTVCPAQPAP
jgi:hypothetical protein